MIAVWCGDWAIDLADLSFEKDGVEFRRHVSEAEFAEMTSLLGGWALRVGTGQVVKTHPALPLFNHLLRRFLAGKLDVTGLDSHHDRWLPGWE